jgi:hypothetical protein
MSWTYRVRKKAIGPTELGYGLVELYNLNGDAWTKNNMAPVAVMEADDADADQKALDELRWQLERMLEALSKPILNDDTVPATDNAEPVEGSPPECP